MTAGQIPMRVRASVTSGLEESGGYRSSRQRIRSAQSAGRCASGRRARSLAARKARTTEPWSTPTSTAATTSAQSQQNEFLQLLVAQLQSQNPLDPMDGTQFVSQLAQFSSLQELTAMHNDLNNIQTYLQPATTATAASPASSSPASSNSKDSSSNPFQIA